MCITAKPTSEFALAYYLRSSAILRQQKSFNLVNMVRQVRKGGYAALSMSETNFPEILSMTGFFLGSSRTSYWMTSSSAVAKRTTFLIKWILNYQDSICTCVLSYIWSKGKLLAISSFRVFLSRFAFILSNYSMDRESIIS